jgi:tetratricopeptide (TPR) repeat protein
LDLKPDDGYITDSLGWVYYQRGDYAAAREWLEKAHTLVPGDPIITEHLADVYVKMDRVEEALELYRRALELNPTEERARDIRRKLDALTVR